MIFSPWKPLGYGLILYAPFYITLLNYNKTKCNRKSWQIAGGSIGWKKERAAEEEEFKLGIPIKTALNMTQRNHG